MRRRRCQRLLKVLRWDIITLMALLEQLVLPAEDPSFTRFSFFLDRRESTLWASTSLLFEDSRRARSSFWILLNSERGVDPGVTKPATVHVTWIYADYLLFFLQLCLLGPDLMHLPICRVDTSWSSGSVMMNMMKLDWFINTTQVVYGEPFSLDWSETHGSVHEYGRGLISLRGRGGNIFSPSLSLQENNA